MQNEELHNICSLHETCSNMIRCAYKFCSKNGRGTDHLEGLGIGGTAIQNGSPFLYHWKKTEMSIILST
jgi:hypothetical protein